MNSHEHRQKKTGNTWDATYHPVPFRNMNVKQLVLNMNLSSIAFNWNAIYRMIIYDLKMMQSEAAIHSPIQNCSVNSV